MEQKTEKSSQGQSKANVKEAKAETQFPSLPTEHKKFISLLSTIEKINLIFIIFSPLHSSLCSNLFFSIFFFRFRSEGDSRDLICPNAGARTERAGAGVGTEGDTSSAAVGKQKSERRRKKILLAARRPRQ